MLTSPYGDLRGRQATPEFMQFGCRQCNRSFNELMLWDRLKNKDYHWICTSCNNPLTREADEKRKMVYGCRKCNHTFEELNEWEWLKHCGDHWKCLHCDNDITRDPETVYKEAMALADELGRDLFQEIE